MNKQRGEALTFDAHFLDTTSTLGAAGLTVSATVYGPDGAAMVSDQPATEIGGGLYSYTLPGTSVIDAGHYRCLFATAAETVLQRALAALWIVGTPWVERVDAAISTRATAAALETVDSVVDGIAGTIAQTVVVPTSSAVSTDGGTLYLVRGNSYTTGEADWTPPSWTYTGDVPDLSDADVYLRLPGAGDIAMTASAIEGGYTLSCDLTMAQTGAINGDDWEILAKWRDEQAVVTGIRRLLAGKVDWQ